MKGYKFIILSKILCRHLKPGLAVIVIFLILFLISCFTFWYESEESVFLFGVIDWYDVTLSSVREESFRVLFYDLYSTFWLFLLMTYLPNKLLLPISNSFSVNQNLWMRFLPEVTILDVGLSRVYSLLVSLCIILVFSLIWIFTYSFIKEISVRELLIPVLGLIGHMIFSVGLLLWVCSNNQLTIAVRKSWCYLLLFLPILLYMAGSSFANKLGGFFPYTSPFSAKYNGAIVTKPFLTTLLIGLVLIIFYIIHNTVLQRRYEKHE